MNPMQPDWLTSGTGEAPSLRWGFTTDTPLVGLDIAIESGSMLSADDSGSLYQIDGRGRVVSATSGFGEVGLVTWSGDAGGCFVIGRRELCRVSVDLEVVWSTTMPDDILAVAQTPAGNHIAVSLADRSTHILDANQKPVARFSTIIAMRHLNFLVEDASLIGAAEHGLLCRHGFSGAEVWNERPSSRIGEMSLSGDASRLFLAAFNHGIQIYDQDGQRKGAFMLEGTPQSIATSYDAKRVAAATQEGHLYWLDGDGELIWATVCEDTVHSLHVDPFGRWLCCGFESGRIVRLEWGS
jgi:hypothetical protein